ncbi:aminotransferase class V-fold PLP-dependent enzyme [Candidatus Micrarchaeota archaeon]|nr:aminotransferase class V-fold PLP-dependent enzyme [Candidatus Micrarchaeota archaeon]
MIGNDIRNDFPLLKNNPNLIYFDSACTALKPKSVINAEAEYYEQFGACAGRSSHQLGRKTNENIDLCRESVARLVGADPQGLIWTKNTTEGLNIIVNGLDYSKRKKVVTTNMEHHAVLLPLIRLRDNGTINLEILQCNNDEGKIGIEQWKDSIDKETALIVTNGANNTTGQRQDIRTIGKIARDAGAMIAVDGAQSVPHHKVDFKSENIDFLCFSAHKMLGPSGIGALVAKKEHLAKIKPLAVGGGNVKTVSLGKIEWMNDNTRFEAGVQHYSGIFGFAAAVEYLKKIGMAKIEEHEKRLTALMLKELQNAGVQVYGDANRINHGALFSFNFKKAKPHDVSLMLDQNNIAVRSGFFCAQPAMEAIGAKDGAVRASAYIYNNEEEVRKFGQVLQKIGVVYR